MPQEGAPVPADGAPSSSWVRFEDEEKEKAAQILQDAKLQPLSTAGLNDKEYSGAVIKAESVHVNLDRSLNRSPEKPERLKKDGPPAQYSGAVINTESVHVNLDRSINRSMSEEPEHAVSAAKTPDKSVTLRSVDLREGTNGRALPGSGTRTSALGNTGLIRQGFGKL
jgi:hypothetical protein